MLRFAWGLVLLAACGASVDDRPLSVEYATEAILAPTCGGAQCHSTFVQSRGDVFDTVEGARSSLVNNGLIRFDSTEYDPMNPGSAALILWLTETDPFGLGIGRMPYDAPMPNEDIEYLKKWIKAGAPGAQCDPSVGMACNNNVLVMCNSDWTFGQQVQVCPTTCAGAVCS